jgi:hypothetical protein
MLLTFWLFSIRTINRPRIGGLKRAHRLVRRNRLILAGRPKTVCGQSGRAQGAARFDHSRHGLSSLQILAG